METTTLTKTPTGFTLTKVYDFGTAVVEKKDGQFSAANRDATLNAGFEMMIANFVAPRLGYIYDHDGKIEGFTFGFGIRAPIGGGLNFDYASVPKAEELGRESKFSINYKL